MIDTEVTPLIARPRQEVFDFVSDLANRPQWDKEVISTEWTPRARFVLAQPMK